MNLHLEGQRVVITGASRGIGLACAAAYLAEGCHVTLVASQDAALQAALASLHALPEVAVAGRLDSVCANLGSLDGVRSLTPWLERADIVVNNAGAIPGGGLEAIDSEAWHRAWDLKVHGYIEVTRAALPSMMQRGAGVILNVIGIFGVRPSFDYLCGSTGNAALAAFTRAVGGHAPQRGVRVLGINPGATRTDRLEALYRHRAQTRFGDPEQWRTLLGELPFGRLAEPQEMADLIVFLTSRRASYLSGVVVDADGGHQYRGT